jgi:fructose-1,6-bisphosphatase-3
LIYHSYGLLLAAHHVFESTQKAIKAELDIDSDTRILETKQAQLRVRDTGGGREIREQVANLQLLLKAYRSGLIKENKVDILCNIPNI